MATLHPRMFIAQSTLEAWMDSGLASLEGDAIKLERPGRTYRLEDAVRFRAPVVDPASDDEAPSSAAQGAAEQLVGKVLTERRLGELGGERLGNSVLFGQLAFDVEPGYVGTLLEGDPSGPS